MRLRWELTPSGLYRGYSPDGNHELAQVGHVPGTGPGAWIVWLPLQQGELFDQFPDPATARAAAEAALDPYGSGAPADRDRADD